MELLMCGLDHVLAPVALRERLSFPPARAVQVMEAVRRTPEVMGCILLSTCNRTELYLTVSDQAAVSPARLLCRAAGEEYAPFAAALVSRRGRDCARHLMEVAAGLRSQIWGEDQIVSQVKRAMELAQGAGLGGAVLDTLFRTAVSAGKEAQTQVSVQNVPLSVSYSAVQQLEQHAGTLDGKTCLVIGNGSMGRLAASLLVQYGCRVFMTLRSYHHGETVIPFGVQPVPYEQRFLQMEAAEIVISATRSPHHTITKKQLEALSRKPVWILDLAMPRDVEADCGTVEGVTLWNLDDLHSSTAPDETALAALRQIAEQYTDTFQMWRNYRDAVPYMQQLKELTTQRILHSTAAEPYAELPQLEEIVRLVTERTVDMLMGSMKSEITPELVRQSCAKIKDRGRF